MNLNQKLFNNNNLKAFYIKDKNQISLIKFQIIKLKIRIVN